VVVPGDIELVAAPHTETVDSGSEASALHTEPPEAGTPGRTIDRAAGKADSIVGKAAAVADKVAAMLEVYSTYSSKKPPPSET
jgi:hypothetical protein